MNPGLEYLPTGFVSMDTGGGIHPKGIKRALDFKQQGYFKHVTKRNTSGYTRMSGRSHENKKSKRKRMQDELMVSKTRKDRARHRNESEMALKRARADEQILTHMRGLQKAQYANKNLPEAIRRHQQSRLSMIEKLKSRATAYDLHRDRFGNAVRNADLAAGTVQQIKGQIDELPNARDNYLDVVQMLKEGIQDKDKEKIEQANHYLQQPEYQYMKRLYEERAYLIQQANVHHANATGEQRHMNRTEGNQYRTQIDHMQEQFLNQGATPSMYAGEDVGVTKDRILGLQQMISDYPGQFPTVTNSLQLVAQNAGSGRNSTSAQSVFQHAMSNIFRANASATSNNSGEPNSQNMFWNDSYGHQGGIADHWLQSIANVDPNYTEGSAAELINRAAREIARQDRQRERSRRQREQAQTEQEDSKEEEEGQEEGEGEEEQEAGAAVPAGS